MKVRFGRSIILRIFAGCKSDSGGLPSHTTCKEERVENSSSVTTRLGRGIHRLIRSLRNISLVFAYRGKEEEEEAEMEIGFPTDVKHLTHIGCDWSITTLSNDDRNSGNLKAEELESLPSISLKQLEMVMAASSPATGL